MSERRTFTVTMDALPDDLLHWDGKSEIALIPKIDLDEMIERAAEQEVRIKKLIDYGNALIADVALFATQEQAEHYTVVINEWKELTEPKMGEK